MKKHLAFLLVLIAAFLSACAKTGSSQPAAEVIGKKVTVNGGKATINGVAGEKLNNVGVGLTLGYQVNSNLNLTFGYKSTVNDSSPGDLKMDSFMITLVYGWHPLIEGSKRLKSGE